MISEPNFRSLVRAGGAYDLLVTAPFATPWTFALVDDALRSLHVATGAAGELPPFPPAHALMAHLLGSVVTVWSVLRIRHPDVRSGRFDAAARALFAAWMLYAVVHGATTLVLGFFVVEVAFGVAQSLPVHPDGGPTHQPDLLGGAPA